METGKLLLYLAAVGSEIQLKIEAAYESRVFEDRIQLFNEALAMGIQLLTSQELSELYELNSTAHDYYLSSLYGEMSECLIQQELLYYSHGQIQNAKLSYETIKNTFSVTPKPGIMSYFAMAYGFWLLKEKPSDVSPQEWYTVMDYYLEVLKRKDELEEDRCGVLRNTYYCVGVAFKYGWGVEKDHQMAKDYLESAKNKGMDCQDVIDSLTC